MPQISMSKMIILEVWTYYGMKSRRLSLTKRHVQSSNDFNEITAAQQRNQDNYNSSPQVDLDLLWNEATTSHLNQDTHMQSNNDFNEIAAADQDNGSNAFPQVDFDISVFLS